MRVLSLFGKMILFLLLVALVVLPLGLIYEISQREMEQYSVPEIPVFRESAYGKLCQATRVDLKESVTVTGQFQSYSYAFVELEQRYPDRIRWLVNPGQEIREGQVLGIYMGDDVISEVTGILDSINAYGTEPHLKVKLLEPIELECAVSRNDLALLQGAKELTMENGTPVTVNYVATVRNSDGSTTVRLTMDQQRYGFGDTVKEMKLLTGNAYLRVLVLPEDCLYQKESGEDNPWYVRQVTAEGTLISELEVSRGISSGGLVCVAGIREGQWFDAGYKQVMAGG